MQTAVGKWCVTYFIALVVIANYVLLSLVRPPTRLPVSVTPWGGCTCIHSFR